MSIGPSQEDVNAKRDEYLAELIGKTDRGEVEDSLAAASNPAFADLLVAIQAQDKLEIGNQVMRIMESALHDYATAKANNWANREQAEAEHAERAA